MGAYFMLFPARAGPDADPDPVHPLFHRDPGLFLPGHLVRAAVLERRRQRRQRPAGWPGGRTSAGLCSACWLLKIFDACPGTGMSDPLRRIAARTTTDRLQLDPARRPGRFPRPLRHRRGVCAARPAQSSSPCPRVETAAASPVRPGSPGTRLRLRAGVPARRDAEGLV
ncbi:MAG: hypothetical protein MZV70_49340 [Desulfobacterales bacterium]|nr:hypothetical protein [Desulfobacterales bacterium]